MQETEETLVLSLGQEDSLEEDMATHASIVPWGIPWTEEPGGLQSMGSQRVGHDWSGWAHTGYKAQNLGCKAVGLLLWRQSLLTLVTTEFSWEMLGVDSHVDFVFPPHFLSVFFPGLELFMLCGEIWIVQCYCWPLNQEGKWRAKGGGGWLGNIPAQRTVALLMSPNSSCLFSLGFLLWIDPGRICGIIS